MLNRNGRILLVNNTNVFEGVITFREMQKTYKEDNLSISEICNKECKFIYEGEDIYKNAKIIMSDYPTVRDIPVISKKKSIIGIISREEIFWKQFYRQNRLPRMHYAYCLYNAAFEARALGYNAVSAIEFGVAGGNGLINLEFHARAIERILGIKVDIYGFDTGEGLPLGNAGYKDMIHIWPDGSYRMDKEKLQSKLRSSTLVMGDMNETIYTFFDKYRPSHVGCMLIDVDRYSSTLPIMKMIEMEDNYFLPRIYMYFDDISPAYEFQGEALAIKEFNRRHEDMKISPEGTYGEPEYKRKIKTCHRFYHEKYNQQTMMYDGWEITESDLELPLDVTLI